MKRYHKKFLRKMFRSLVKIFFLMMVIITVIFSVRGAEITEIMFNPAGSDAG